MSATNTNDFKFLCPNGTTFDQVRRRPIIITVIEPLVCRQIIHVWIMNYKLLFYCTPRIIKFAWITTKWLVMKVLGQILWRPITNF